MKRSMSAAVAATLLLPASAGAHVTIQPRQVEAGAFARIDVRVPNERDDKGTTKVELQMPPGFATVSYEPEPGWTAKVTRRPAAEPIDLHGEEVTEEIDRVTFSADDGRAAIEPGQFRDFGLSVRIPQGRAGEKLTFKALQTYHGGEIVRWIGPEAADEPAPTVTLTGGRRAAGPAAAPEKDPDALAIIALVVGGLGLAAGVIALGAARRRPQTV